MDDKQFADARNEEPPGQEAGSTVQIDFMFPKADQEVPGQGEQHGFGRSRQMESCDHGFSGGTQRWSEFSKDDERFV